MKCIPAFSAIAVLGLAACDTMTGPISSGDFDPLRPPGGNIGKPTLTPGATFKGGQFVRAAIDNTAFFKTRPKGDADADKLLPRGTSMKVISTSGSYTKVELDSGEVGFIPSVMLEDPSKVSLVPSMPVTAPGQYQIYPPLPGAGAGMGEPLPPLDPKGLPPDGAIPTVIDPEAPPNTNPVPAVTPTTDTFPTPAPTPTPAPLPPVESIPLPPNGE
jgi:hypothetical protein